MSWEKRKDELREETARTYNKKKKTGKWCRGKVGVHHVTEIVINHNMSRITCRWYPIYISFMRRDEGPKDWRYNCRHALKCTNCGKYVEYFIKPEQCPDLTPRPATPSP